MLADSNLLANLQAFAFSRVGDPLCIYGDPTYPLRLHLQAPFRNALLTPQMEAYNSSMSSVRSSVEWLFGDIVNYFKLIDFKKNLKISLRSVGKICVAAAEVCNSALYFIVTLTLVPYSNETPSQNGSCKGKNYEKVLRMRRQKHEIT